MTDTQLMSAGLRRQKRRKKAVGEKISSCADLAVGDLVVHEQHGIGRFAGVVRMPVDGAEKDYMKISYAGTDSLYVPATQLDLVTKYVGAGEDTPVRLSKLGGAEWQRTKDVYKRQVFLSDLFANIGHIASPYLLDNAALERDESQTLRVPRSSQRMKDRGRSSAAFMTSPAFSEAASSSRVEREKVVLSISQMATMEFFLTTFPPPIFRYITASCLPRP